MLFGLAWQDHVVVVVYLLGVTVLGAVLSRKQTSDEEYLLAGRRMPWMAVGVSVIATLLSALTYLSEPGEIWKSGVTHLTGKMLAIPLEMAVVWLFIIPFLMRFRFTSAYEYLEHRFGAAARLLGVALFCTMVVTWMGIIVLYSSKPLAQATGMELKTVIATTGVVATVYTVLGGLRAVIWTDVAQVALLMGGAVLAMVFVGWETGSAPLDWYRLVHERVTGELPLFDASPYTRATVMTVALSMFCWHICTHTANQMTVQRYFSTADLRAARRSFVTGSLLGVAINLMLATVGMALFYYYYQTIGPDGRPEGIDPATKEADMIFPMFVVNRLPPGLAGGLLAAMLAASMSTIDSGINSAAAVLSVEWRRWRANAGREPESAATGRGNHVRSTQVLTLLLGLFVTASAYQLNEMTGQRNIVEMMPRSFNCFIGPLGGLFLTGIFLPRAGGRVAIAATLAGLAASIGLSYGQEIFKLPAMLSFTWVIPGSLLATLGTALVLSLVAPSPVRSAPGLTWFSRHEQPRG